MILCTFPGKFGDLLWALPTIRALARRTGESIALHLPASLASIGELLREQPYISPLFIDTSWSVLNTAPTSPRIPPSIPFPSATILHLGYRDWPKRTLPFETLDCYNAQRWSDPLPFLDDAELDLSTPWIQLTCPQRRWHFPWVHGFTDEYFELKYGIVDLLIRQHRQREREGMVPVRIGRDPRWNTEAQETANTWIESADLLRCAGAFLGCNSALHVLAVAMGIPVVMMEPNPHRHHWIFYPLGDTGPQVQLVRGIDNAPTFDARHVRDTLYKVLAAQRAKDVDSPTPR